MYLRANIQSLKKQPTDISLGTALDASGVLTATAQSDSVFSVVKMSHLSHSMTKPTK